MAAAFALACGDPAGPGGVPYLTDAAPSWSADGRTIAFVRTEYGASTRQSARTPASPGPVASRTPAAEPGVATSPAIPPSTLRTVDADGGSPRALAPEVDVPAWLPDGRALLAVRRRDRRLVCVDLDGGAVQPVGDADAGYFAPVVSAAGQVAVVRDRGDDGRWGGRPRIHLLDAGGASRLLAVSGDPGPHADPTWGPNGALAYQAWASDHPAGLSGTGVVVVTDTAGAAPRRVAGGVAPAWSPTGAWIAYLTDPWSDAPSLRLVRPDGTGDRLVLEGRRNAGAPTGRAAWSPDGTRLVVARQFVRGTELWVVGADGGGLRRLTAAGPAGG